MPRSFPIALALAAFTVVGVCGTASAVMNNPNPSTPAPKALLKTKSKMLGAQTTQMSSAVTTSNATATTISKARGLKASNAAALTTSNAAGQTSSKVPGLKASNPAGLITSIRSGPAASKPAAGQTPPATPKTVAELQKDIASEQQYIGGLQQQLTRLENSYSNIPENIKKALASNSFHWDPKDPSQMKCDTNGKCVAFLKLGLQALQPRTTFEVPVDASGHPLSETQDVIIAAYKTIYTTAINSTKGQIAADQNQINADNKRLEADYAANPTLKGGDNIDIPRASTAIHAQ